MMDDSGFAVEGEQGVADGVEVPAASSGDLADSLVSTAEAVARRAESFIDQAESVTAAYTDLAAVRGSGRQRRRSPEQSSMSHLEQGEVEPSVTTPAPGPESPRTPPVGRPHTQHGALVPMIEAGYHRVGIIRLGSLRRSKGWPGTLRATGLVLPSAMWPLLLNGMLLVVAREHALVTLHANLWVVALGLVNAASVMTAWRGWWHLHQAASDLERLLGGPEGEVGPAAWFQRTLGYWRQVSVSLVLVPVGCFLLAVSQPAIEDQLEIGFVSYVTVGWTGVLASNGAYWVLVVAALGRRILRLKDLRLVWHSPASTPGIAGLSSVYTLGTAAGLAIVLGLELLALQVSTYGESQVLRAMSVTFVVAGALLALVFGILPHWWLYQTVRDARRSALKQLSPPTDTLPRTPAEMTVAIQRAQLYRLVESSPGLPFNTTSMVQYAVTVLATLTATLLIILLDGG